MCGISGIVRFKDKATCRGREIHSIANAITVQHHRGPDDSGICGIDFEKQIIEENKAPEYFYGLNHVYNGVFGFNRLSIKDVSELGHQPMISGDGKVVIIFNGEIYNDEMLRKELIMEGVKFKGTSDTEVILNLYLNHGILETLNKLNGMFAFAIADVRTRYIYIARDRVGIKPLYYHVDAEGIEFSSELKGLLQFDNVEKKLDIDAYNSRLIFSRPSDKVLIEGCHLLEPGKFIAFNYRGEIKKKTFFNIDSYKRHHANESFKNLEETIEEADRIISDAVSRQLVSDVNVGCQLSGGIDSSIVTYYANKNKTNKLNDTVSIVKEINDGEEKYIDIVENSLELNAHKFVLSDNYFVDNYQQMVWDNDAPLYKPFFSAFNYLAFGAKDYVTVLLSGEGLDEIAAGYNRFASGVFQPFVAKMNSCNSSVRSYTSYAEYAVMSDSTQVDLLSVDYKEYDKLIQEQIDIFNSFEGSNLEKHLKYEVRERLPESLLRQDKMTMAHSIENRVPLLDNEVIDFTMSLPEEYLIRFGDVSPANLSDNPLTWVQGKYLFKELIAKKFGRDFAYRNKATMNESMNERRMICSAKFREYLYEQIIPHMHSRGLMDTKEVLRCYENINTISIKEFNGMWRAIGLETWCQLFLDRKMVK